MAKAKAPFKRGNRVQAVAGVVEGVLEKSLGNKLLQAGLLRQLQRRWRQVCPLLGAQTWPIGVTNSTLRVACASSSVAQELKYAAPTVLDAANLLAGYPAVSKLAATVQPLPAPPPAALPETPPAPAAKAIAAAGALCKGVADTDLRDALGRLGAWILNEEKKR